jgi:hypothetical protein
MREGERRLTPTPMNLEKGPNAEREEIRNPRSEAERNPKSERQLQNQEFNRKEHSPAKPQPNIQHVVEG